MRLALVATCSLVVSLFAGCSDDAPGAPADPDASVTLDSGTADGGSEDASQMDAARADAAADASMDLGAARDAYVPDAAANVEWLDAEFCMPTMRALCEARAACSCTDESIDTCLAEFGVENCVPEEFRSGIASGALDINRSVLTTIRDSVTALASSCRTPGFVERAIFSAFYMPIAIGDACPSDTDYYPCGGGDGVCLDGECTDLAGNGERCDIGCKTGLYCDSSDTCSPLRETGATCGLNDDCAAGALCRDGVCKLAAGVGEACDDTHVCGEGSRCVSGLCSDAAISCSNDSECVSGESCVGDYTSECRLPGGPGAECSYIDECADGLGCDVSGSSWGRGVCVELPGDVGDDCGHTSFCTNGLMCTGDDSVCITPPGIGEECRYGSVVDTRKYVACANGLACVAGACQFAPGIGESCDEDGICTDGAACQYDFRSGYAVCTALRGEGEECFSDDVCMNRDFYRCAWEDGAEAGTCTRKLGIGEDCFGGECETGLSCIYPEDDEWRSEPGSCLPPPGPGEYCNGECGGTATCVGFVRDASCVSSLCGGGSGGPTPGPGPDPIPL